MFFRRFLWLCLALLAHQAAAQHQQEVDSNGMPAVDAELMASLKSTHSKLPEQAAVDIAEIITALKNDPETAKLVEEMTSGSGQSIYQ